METNHGNANGNNRANDADTSEQSATAFIESGRHKNNEWNSDGGASQHITGCDDWVIDVSRFDCPSSNSLLDNSTEAKVIGNVQIEAFIYEWQLSTISKVLYVPVVVNLFSERQLAQKGFKILRYDVRFIYYNKTDSPLLTADMKKTSM
ncbi:unnamed protein product [Orchesella dallaii]|uniref:Retrovirus-related Pol polyprotein from transposon TNT 1-94-like beta-barrel domain-containing protein n=1 Tax=Orchesella dallaii TaxID=48710 RepID=A0ABP1S0H1_9HEXA